MEQETKTEKINGNGAGNVAKTENGSGDRDHKEKEKETSTKGNEDKKIFVGGIAYDVSNEDLSAHFATYGEVTQVQVKYDRNTGRSRGFAFVEFANGESCKKALAEKEQQIKGKTIEVKPAKSRENKKVFVGGLPADFPEESLRSHFEQYGKVEDIEWPYDKQTKARRNFAFIVFEEEESADRASSTAKQTFGSRDCDVKKAVPQGKRFNGMGRGGGAMRGGYGGRGGAAVNGWYASAGGWNMPYGATNTWGDWYPQAAQGYYGQNNGTAYGYSGSVAPSNGYDYSQNNNRNTTQRFQTQAQQY